MSYVDTVIFIEPLSILETWSPIYRGQERTVRDRLRAGQAYSYVYFQYAPCLTDLTFEFIRRPTPPILSPSSRTFTELTLVTGWAWSMGGCWHAGRGGSTIVGDALGVKQAARCWFRFKSMPRWSKKLRLQRKHGGSWQMKPSCSNWSQAAAQAAVSIAPFQSMI
jgi:hypothetical protein